MSALKYTATRGGEGVVPGQGKGRDAFLYYDRAAGIAALTTVTVGGETVKVTRTTKLVAFRLAHHWNHTTGQCNPYQETLAAEIGESVAVVEKAVALLKRIGALDVLHGRGNRASYRLREAGSGGSRTATRARNQIRHQAAVPSTNCEGGTAKGNCTVGQRSSEPERSRSPLPPAQTATRTTEREQAQALLDGYRAAVGERRGCEPRRRAGDLDAAVGLVRQGVTAGANGDEYVEVCRWAVNDGYTWERLRGAGFQLLARVYDKLADKATADRDDTPANGKRCATCDGYAKPESDWCMSCHILGRALEVAA